ncbi:MAG: hypothetical protein AAF638_03910 [Pseudomonadota bacterium]
MSRLIILVIALGLVVVAWFLGRPLYLIQSLWWILALALLAGLITGWRARSNQIAQGGS